MTIKKSLAESLSEAQMAWNLRAREILESDAGRARPAMAIELALGHNMAAEAAVKLLALAPPEKAAASNGYLEAMARFGPVGLPAGQSTQIGEDVKAARIAEIKKNVPRQA